MQILLSSDALPGGSFDELSGVGRRRSLAGLELALGAGHAHGADASACAVRHARDQACFSPTPEDLPIRWLLFPREVPLAMRTIWASAAYRLGAGLLLRQPVPEPAGAPCAALLHGTDPAEAERAVRWAVSHGAQTAWEVRPAQFDPEAWSAVFDRTAPHLAHVRLLGAGPEAEHGANLADGTGWLMSHLALRGYAGTVALAPSAPEHLADWERWLRRGRGWGCGTAAEKAAARAARLSTSSSTPEPTP